MMGLELFDELLEIEQSSAEKNANDFNREDFLDDLINSAPDSDPLLDESDIESDEDTEHTDSDNELLTSDDDAAIANEFGVPQDSD
ncbi:hypothetical protein P4S72_03910 [Vibrio sp. PP-XX7]